MNINKSAWGNMTVSGLAGATNLQHTGRTGNIDFTGVAASNYLYRQGYSGPCTPPMRSTILDAPIPLNEILPYLTLLITRLDMPAPVNEIFPE
jgi:hypothetical protein